MSKTYILQKDLPDVDSGARFELGAALDAYYLTSDKTGTKYNCYVYPKDYVENNPTWFLPLQEFTKDFDKVPLGLYEIFWESGGSSLAAVGNLHDGDRWIAPINWTAQECPTGRISHNRMSIDKMVLLHAYPKPQAENKPDEEILEVPQEYIATVIELCKNKDGWMVESVKDRGGKYWQHEYWNNGGCLGHGFMGNSYGYWLSTMNRKGHSVHSVKRLNDGEVFSIGDMVVNRLATNLPHEGYKITALIVIQDKIQVSVRGGFFWLDDIEKVSPPVEESKPDWEIVEFRNPYGYAIVQDIYDNGWYIPKFRNSSTKPAKYEDVLYAATCGVNKIHSVKRLPDGIIFSVDEVTDGGNKIHAFELTGDHLQVHMQTVSDPKEGWLTNIKSLVKKQPQKEEQRIRVTDIYDATVRVDAGVYFYKTQINTNCPIEENEFPKIKQAIEQVLNEPEVTRADMDKWLEEFKRQPINFYEIGYIPKSIVDAMCEDVWDAARAKAMASHNIEVYKYEDLEDYKKSKQ